jgi:hypothetical protein
MLKNNYLLPVSRAIFLFFSAFMAFTMDAQGGQDVTIDFNINGNVFGNSNPPDYHCQPGTICITDIVEPCGNILRVTAGSITNGSAYGGFGAGSVDDNIVILSGGDIAYSLLGVRSQAISDGTLTAHGNSAVITGGTVGESIYGASILVINFDVNIFANLNSVTIETSSAVNNTSRISGLGVTSFGYGVVSAELNRVSISGADVCYSWVILS